MIRTLRRPGREGGLSLIEIMVALVVGSLVVIAAGQILVGNRGTYRTRDDLALAQENGQFALDMLTRHIRLAGYVAAFPSGDPSQFVPMSSRAPDYGFPAPASTCAGSKDHHVCGADGATDVLQVRLRGINKANDVVAEGGVVDCEGNPIGLNDLVEHRFMIRNDATTGRPQLVCYVIKGQAAIAAAAASAAAPAGITPVVIADNIRNLQVLYGRANGIDASSAYPVVNNWVTASDPTLLYDTVAVRVALLAEGIDTGTTPSADSNKYYFFGKDYVATADPGAVYSATGDSVIRKLFSTTVTLRNRVN